MKRRQGKRKEERGKRKEEREKRKEVIYFLKNETLFRG